MTKKAVGRVQKTSTSETTNGEKFGILLEDENGNENWYNGWGSVPEGVTEGAKVQIPYEINESNGSLYRNIEDKDAVDIIEEGSSSSSSSASSSAKSESFDRQNAIKTAGQIFKGKGQLDAEELQQFKLLVEELDHYNQEGEWDNLDDLVADKLLESKGNKEESSQEEQEVSEEGSETSEEEVTEEDSSAEEEEATEEEEESSQKEEEDLQEEMKKAVEENSEGEDVIIGEEGEEVEEE